MASPSISHSETLCCTPEQAWTWCRELAAGALAGDDDFRASLPGAVEHFLSAVRFGHALPLEGMR